MNTTAKTTVKLKQNSKKPLYRALFLFFILCIGCFSFLGFNIRQNRFQFNANIDKRFHVVMNFDTGHVDQGFNQGAIEGVCLANNIPKTKCNANPELRKIISFAYPGSTNNVGYFHRHVSNRYNVQGVKNFVFPGFSYSPFLTKFVRKFEKLKINLIAIDTYYSPKKGLQWPKNLWQFTFRHYFAGYHAGLYAAAYALKNADKFKDGNSDKIGKQIRFASLGGLGIAPIYNYAIGFKLGIQMINANREKFNPKYNKNDRDDVGVEMVAHKNIGGFGSNMIPSVKTKMEKFLNQEGVSIVFSIAVSLTDQMLGSVRDANTRFAKQGYKHFVIGVDVDQDAILNKKTTEEPESDVLTSAQIQIPFAVRDIIKKIQNKETPLATTYFGGHEYGTIPLRYRKDKNGNKKKLWAEVAKALGPKINLNHITQTPDQVSGVPGATIDSSGQINRLMYLIFWADKTQTLKRQNELHKALNSSEKFLPKLTEWLKNWKKK